MKLLTNGIIFTGFLMVFGIIYLYASQGAGTPSMRNSVAFVKKDPKDTTRTHTRTSGGGMVYIHRGSGGGTTIRGNGNNGSSGSGSFRSGSRSGRGK